VRIASAVCASLLAAGAAGAGGGVYFVGTDRSETVRGSSVRDTLNGAGGDDRLFGLGGRDWIAGGSGDDVLAGGAHHDGVGGGRGHDRLQGGEGADLLWGHAGADTIDARDPGSTAVRASSECTSGPPPDWCRPRGPGDGVWAGPGNDVIHSRDANVDYVWCEGGHDTVIADRRDRLPTVGGCEVVRRG
jgi:Ca2+-binding RTX toxin-like protein